MVKGSSYLDHLSIRSGAAGTAWMDGGGAVTMTAPGGGVDSSSSRDLVVVSGTRSW